MIFKPLFVAPLRMIPIVMVDRAHDVVGVRDITITTPVANIVILEDQLPIAQDNLGNSLVVIV